MKKYIYPVNPKRRKVYSDSFKTKYNNLYKEYYFQQLSPTGKTNVYSRIKKSYCYEKYLDQLENKDLRRNITKIRISAHCLPIELLRKKGIEQGKRLCNLCNTGSIGSEVHVLIHCQNKDIVSIRKTLIEKLSLSNQQYRNMNFKCIFQLLLLASDQVANGYFAIFLKKVFRLVTENY